VLGALTVGAYDRVLSDVLTSAVRGVGSAIGSSALGAADLHGSSFALFGIALYVAILLRSRPPRERATWSESRKLDLLPEQSSQ